MKKATPTKVGDTIRFRPRDGVSVDWSALVVGYAWAAAPRAGRWWARVGDAFVEVYRRSDQWFESPTPGAEPKPRKPSRKSSRIPAGAIPLF